LASVVFAGIVQHYIDAVLDQATVQAVWDVVRRVLVPVLRFFLGGGDQPFLPPAIRTML
jgi:hypothetical protein